MFSTQKASKGTLDAGQEGKCHTFPETTPITQTFEGKAETAGKHATKPQGSSILASTYKSMYFPLLLIYP